MRWTDRKAIEQRLQTEIMDNIRITAQRLNFLSQPDQRVAIFRTEAIIDRLQAKGWDRFTRNFVVLK